MKNELGPQRPQKTLHRGVDVTVSLATHGGPPLELFNPSSVFMGTELAPTIRMVVKLSFRMLGGNGPKKRLDDQVLRHMGSHGVADALSSTQIHVAGEPEYRWCRSIRPDQEPSHRIAESEGSQPPAGSVASWSSL